PGAERFAIGLVVDPARARFKQPKARTHVVRTEMEMIEVSTGNIVEFGTGKKSTEANIDAALAELVDGEARWADDTKMS
ncbi:MAG: hypothetical protein QOI30_1526, partial [Mycobacterium sp.]|nr:hypothetical protein [Mycobacterium sp.]